MQSRLVFASTLVTLLAGCAALGRLTGDGGRDAMSRGFEAAAGGDVPTAYVRLERAYAGELDGADRAAAALALAAIDLDPRNRAGRPARAAARLARLLRSEGRADGPHRLLAETLYLLALETGAPAYAGPADSAALPRIQRPSLAAKFFRAETRRDSLSREVLELRATLTARTRRLEEAERELARIRELLKR